MAMGPGRRHDRHRAVECQQSGMPSAAPLSRSF